jgi:gliding motility-associated-like protein
LTLSINSTDTDGDGLTDCEETTGVDDPSTPLVPTGTSDPNDPCSPRPCGLIIPDGFTPNGDGYNELFIIEGLENYPGNEIIIFNRWGNEVFGMVEYDNSWDGTRNRGIVQDVGMDVTGDQLPTGTYYYILDTKDESIGNKGIFQGFIYLKR